MSTRRMGGRNPESGVGLGPLPLARLLDEATKLGELRQLGPLRVHERFAVGGMASIHFGWMTNADRLVAVKRLHRHLLADEVFTKMLLDEARLAMQVSHPNVVGVLGIVQEPEELLVAMDYVPGASLAELLREGRLAPPVACAVLVDTLRGLHAAHTARSPISGDLLDIVHRDVSPQNVLVGADGVARVVDFGVAKARIRLQSTVGAVVKGKLAYVSPEQLSHNKVDPRSDVYAASVVLWETLTGRPLFHAPTVDGTLRKILIDAVPPPSTVVPGLAAELDAIVLRGLSRDPEARFPSAAAMIDALGALPAASPADVAARLGSMRLLGLADRATVAEGVRRREAAPGDGSEASDRAAAT